MSPQFWLFVHVVSLFLVFITLGGVATHMLNGGTKDNFKTRKTLAMIHGIGLLMAFVSGFGLIAKRGYSFGDSPWLYGKILCWLLVGLFPIVAYKKILPRWGDFVFLALVATAAVYLVVFRTV